MVLTFSFIVDMSFFTSSELAFDLFIIKPACFLEISAFPILYPFNPNLSINSAGGGKSPLLKMLPRLRHSTGWLDDFLRK